MFIKVIAILGYATCVLGGTLGHGHALSYQLYNQHNVGKKVLPEIGYSQGGHHAYSTSAQTFDDQSDQSEELGQHVQKFEYPYRTLGHEEADHHGPAKYEFEYKVSDHHSGDQKSQHEVRDGDVVKGEYTVADPDGTIRKVQYTADSHNGFNALVTKNGHSVHPPSKHIQHGIHQKLNFEEHSSVPHFTPTVQAEPEEVQLPQAETLTHVPTKTNAHPTKHVSYHLYPQYASAQQHHYREPLRVNYVAQNWRPLRSKHIQNGHSYPLRYGGHYGQGH